MDIGQITNAVSIRERPASVEPCVLGHWEGDLICELEQQLHRHPGQTSHYTMLAKVKNKDTESVIMR
jgi:IS30 family transposase